MKNLILGISVLSFSSLAYCNHTVEKKNIALEKPIASQPIQESKPLTIKLWGETSTNHYTFNMRRKEENQGKGRGSHLAVEDSRLNFDVSGIYNNHEFGYLIGLTGNAAHGHNPIEENRIKVKSFWGTILAGDTKSPSDFMSVDTLYFAGGTGGVLGNFKNVINETTGAVLSTDLLHKLTPKDQTKVIYVSPNYYGFQVAYSYIPDGSHKGEQKLASHSPSTSGIKTIHEDKRLSGQNFHELALKFHTNKTDTFNIAFSGTVIFGKMRDLKSDFSSLLQQHRLMSGITTSDSIKRHNLCSYATGIVFMHNGFSFGGEFLNNRKSGQLKILQNANLGKVWTIGTGFSDNVNKISFVYFNSKRNLGRINTINFGHAKANNLAFTYDRRILSGMTIFAEGILLNLKNSNHRNLNHWNKALNGFSDDVVHSNRGKILVTGGRINF
jgi:hypothetical protein